MLLPYHDRGPDVVGEASLHTDLPRKRAPSLASNVEGFVESVLRFGVLPLHAERCEALSGAAGGGVAVAKAEATVA